MRFSANSWVFEAGWERRGVKEAQSGVDKRK
jgi:hypothetical protein